MRKTIAVFSAAVILVGVFLATAAVASGAPGSSSLVSATPVSLGTQSLSLDLLEAGPSDSADASDLVDATITVPPGANLYQETDPHLLFSGSWGSVTGSGYSGGKAVYAAPNSGVDSVSVTFSGTSLTWIAKTAISYGMAQVTLDGSTRTMVDLFSVSTRYQQAVYNTGTLANRPHTVTIKWTSQKNPSSLGTYICVDAFLVVGSLGGASSTTTASTPTTVAPTTTTTARTTTTTARTTTTTARTTTTTARTTTTTARTTTTTVASPTLNVRNYGAKGDGVTNDQAAVQACINAAAAGKEVYFPAGNYVFSTQVSLKSGVSLRGAGIDQTILTMPAQSSGSRNLLYGNGASNLHISDLTLNGTTAAGRVLAVSLFSYANITIERVKATNCWYALKTTSAGTNLTVRDFSAYACGQVYISHLTGGLFERLHLEMVTYAVDDVQFHCLYLSDDNHNLQLNDVYCSGGGGAGAYSTVSITLGGSGAYTSDYIEFDGLTVNNPFNFHIGPGDYNHVTVKHFTALGTTSANPVVKVDGAHDVVFEDFTASGGFCFLYAANAPKNVTLRNGSYTGTLVKPAGSITNLVVENVG